MSMAKRLAGQRAGRRRRHLDGLIGYYRGGRVTCRVEPDGHVWLVVKWPTGSSWTIGPCSPIREPVPWLVRNKVYLMAFLKKLDHVAGQGPHEMYIGEGLLAQMPAICEYLGVEKFEDGTPRERSSLLLIVESGLLKVCLSDRQNARTLWRSGPSIEEALLSMEVALQNETADWRKSATKTSYGGKPSAKRT